MINEYKESLKKLTADFQEKLSHVRGHNLSLSFLESLEFIAYGQKYPLKGLAHVSQMSPLKFKLEFWDPAIIELVEHEIMERKFGVNVYKEGQALIVTFPALSEENRKQIIKELNHIKEESRMRSRRERDDFLKDLKTKKESGEVSEDVFFKTKEQVDKEIEKFNDELEKIFERKEREVLA